MIYKHNVEQYIWTQHAREKMRHYRLTESRVKRIIRHPARVEEGILEGAVACMQPASAYASTGKSAGGKNYSEIWAMYMMVSDDFLGSSDFRHVRSAPAAELTNGRRNFLPSTKPSKLLLPLSGNQKSLEYSLLGMGKRIKIITAWRYPGKSPARNPIPQNIIREIRQLLGV